MDLSKLYRPAAAAETATRTAPVNPFRLTRQITPQQEQGAADSFDYSQESEESLLGKIGGVGASALGMAGNVLDLPGSMVRDTLVGENPFDQWLSPFSHWEEGSSNTGRDVLTKWGVTDKNKETGISGWVSDPNEAAADIGGFMFELATDPFGWAAGFTKGAGKAAARDAIKKEAVRRPGIKGFASRAFDTTLNTMNLMDPGYHVGRLSDKVAGKQIRKATSAVGKKMSAAKYDAGLKLERWLTKYDADELNPAELKKLPKEHPRYEERVSEIESATKKRERLQADLFKAYGSKDKNVKLVSRLSPGQRVARTVAHAFGVDLRFFHSPAGLQKGLPLGFARTRDSYNAAWASADQPMKSILATTGHEIMHKMRTGDNEEFINGLSALLENVNVNGEVTVPKFAKVMQGRYPSADKLRDAIKVEEGMTMLVTDAFENPDVWKYLAGEELVMKSPAGKEVKLQAPAKLQSEYADAVQQAAAIAGRHLTTREANFYKEAIADMTGIHIGLTEMMLKSEKATRVQDFKGMTSSEWEKVKFGREGDLNFVEYFNQEGTEAAKQFPKRDRDTLFSRSQSKIGSGVRKTIRGIQDISDRLGRQLSKLFSWRVLGASKRSTQALGYNITGSLEEIVPAITLPVSHMVDELNKMDMLTGPKGMAISADIRRAVEINEYQHLPQAIQDATRNLREVAIDLLDRQQRAGMKTEELQDYVNYFARGITPELFNVIDLPGGAKGASSMTKRKFAESLIALKGEGSRTWMNRGAIYGTNEFNELTGDGNILADIHHGSKIDAAKKMRGMKRDLNTSEVTVDGRVPHFKGKKPGSDAADQLLVQETGIVTDENGYWLNHNELFSKYDIEMRDGEVLRKLTPKERDAAFRESMIATRKEMSVGEAKSFLKDKISKLVKSGRSDSDAVLDDIVRELTSGKHIDLNDLTVQQDVKKIIDTRESLRLKDDELSKVGLGEEARFAAKDSDVDELIEMITDPKLVSEEALVELAIEESKIEVVTHATQERGFLSPKGELRGGRSVRGSRQMPSGFTKEVDPWKLKADIADGLTEGKIDDRFDSLVNWIEDKKAANVLEQQGGMFRNNAIVDLSNRLRTTAFRLSVAEKLPRSFASMVDSGDIIDTRIGRGFGESGGKTLDFVMDQLFDHLDKDHVYNLMRAESHRVNGIAKNATQLGEDVSKRIGEMLVAPEVFDDLEAIGGLHKGVTPLEDVMNLMQNYTSLFKAGVLTWPGRFVRDFMSGQMANYLSGYWSMESGLRAQSILFNTADETLVQMPELRRFAEDPKGLNMKAAAYSHPSVGDTVKNPLNPEELLKVERMTELENGKYSIFLEGLEEPLDFNDNKWEVTEKLNDWFTPELAVATARAAYGSFKEGGHFYHRDVSTDSPVGAMEDSVLPEMLQEANPGPAGRVTGKWDLAKKAGGKIIKGAGEGAVNWPRMTDVEGTQWITRGPESLKGKVKSRSQVDFKEWQYVTGWNMIGKSFDDMNRLVSWVEGMRQGMNASDSFKNATRIQLDYRPKTFGPLERSVLKKIFPFYSFFSREAVFLGNELLTNPAGRLGKTLRAQHHAGLSGVEGEEGEDTTSQFVPEHIRREMSIPFGKTADGGRSYLTGFGLMHEDPLSTMMEMISDPSVGGRELLSKMSPIIKGPAEYVLGVSSFKGGPMGGTPLSELDPAVGRILTNFGIRDKLPNNRPAPLMSQGVEHLLANSPLSRALSTLRTLSDTRQVNQSIDYLIGREREPDELGRKEWYETAANLLTGARFASVSPAQAEREARSMMDKMTSELGGSRFSRYNLSRDLRDKTKESDPEKAARMEAIQEWSRRRSKERRERAKLERE